MMTELEKNEAAAQRFDRLDMWSRLNALAWLVAGPIFITVAPDRWPWMFASWMLGFMASGLLSRRFTGQSHQFRGR